MISLSTLPKTYKTHPSASWDRLQCLLGNTANASPACSSQEDNPAGLGRKPPAEVDNVTLIERRLILVPPFLFLYLFIYLFLYPRATRDGRGAWSRMIPPADASYLRAREECPDRDMEWGENKKKKNKKPHSLSQQRSALKIKWQCASACVRKTRAI